jgi:hypothetical protein
MKLNKIQVLIQMLLKQKIKLLLLAQTILAQNGKEYLSEKLKASYSGGDTGISNDQILRFFYWK